MSDRFVGLFKDPLVHFLIAGFLVFIVFELLVAEEVALDKDIYIDKKTILTFMQYRMQAFNEEVINQKYENLSETEKKELIDSYIHMEALYRHANELGLAKNDAGVRMRIIKKLEYLTKESSLMNHVDLSEGNLRRYYDDNKDKYFIYGTVSFSHVFYDYKKNKKHDIEEISKKNLVMLNHGKYSHEEAVKLGDPFYFYSRYTKSSQDYLKNHFGDVMAKRLFELYSAEKKWYGPIYSKHGAHLVNVDSIEPSRYREFSEVRKKVETDYQNYHQNIRYKKNIEEIVGLYNVTINLD